MLEEQTKTAEYKAGYEYHERRRCKFTERLCEWNDFTDCTTCENGYGVDFDPFDDEREESGLLEDD